MERLERQVEQLQRDVTQLQSDVKQLQEINVHAAQRQARLKASRHLQTEYFAERLAERDAELRNIAQQIGDY